MGCLTGLPAVSCKLVICRVKQQQQQRTTTATTTTAAAAAAATTTTTQTNHKEKTVVQSFRYSTHLQDARQLLQSMLTTGTQEHEKEHYYSKQFQVSTNKKFTVPKLPLPITLTKSKSASETGPWWRESSRCGLCDRLRRPSDFDCGEHSSPGIVSSTDQ